MKRIFILIAVFISACQNNQHELSEIRRLSNIEFPDNTKIIFYEDDVESSFKFKLSIKDSTFSWLIGEYAFKKYNSENLYESTSKYSYHDYLISDFKSFLGSNFYFTKSEDLFFYEYENCIAILNKRDKILYGLIVY